MFKTEIIADSKNQYGNRITTFIVTFPRIILAEFNTHRMLSRNSASSRAIPFEKMLKSVQENPFIPIRWMEDHKGMQGDKYFSTIKSLSLDQDWRDARDFAINSAANLNSLGVTKQICNRILEPFMWHTVIVTATEWENFFALRANEAAEIHMQKIAYMMLDEYNKSTPKLLKDGEWHIPFSVNINNKADENELKIATARIARVSYTTPDSVLKENTVEIDIKLHDKLKEMGHMSPFEHCAQVPNNISEYRNENWSGNFNGFTQYRKLIEGENKTDKRVTKK